MLEPDVETRSWDEQLALDDGSYREQLAYLLARSAFYRDKLAAAGVAAPGDADGLPEIAELPLTEKRELKETASSENPIGTHLCADASEIVRIYSTSGTTGTPSYIPLTAGDLANWIAGSARSYAASGVTAGQRIVSTYNAGPFVAGAHVLLARCLRDGVTAALGKPLTMNVSLPIAAVLLDLGFPTSTVKAIPILARTAGLLAHLAEEQRQPIGFLLAAHAEEAIAYEPPGDSSE